MVEEIAIIALLIILNGLFAMAEISIVSSRKSRLEELLRKGNHTAKKVLSLSEHPNKFLSTVQIGITSIGILTGIFGGATLSQAIKSTLINLGVNGAYADDMAIAIVVVIITFFSIVIGELLPKRIGMANPEAIALLAAKPMIVLSRLTAPFVWLLSSTTNIFIKLFGVKKTEASQVTEEEIKALVEEGTTYGTIQEIEQDIVENVFFIGDLRIEKLMTIRSEVVWLDIDDPLEENIQKMVDHEHSIYPICEGDIDNALGVIYTKDLFRQLAGKQAVDLKSCIREAIFLPNNQKAYKALERFRETHNNFGFVLNEYGEVEGIVTINDILEELVGDFTDSEEPTIVTRDDGSLLVDGKMLFYDMIEALEIDDYEPIQQEYNTVAGFMLHHFKEIPKASDKFSWRSFTFEVMDMDGNRIDKILISRNKKSKTRTNP
ncbi:hemolysin family protein [uncultured Acetobacteroides sp.]|uniref:hemolysin family protein n=1 Tax=uncultured Acetobacteroides sp. TaxID=1760811 RepID=UPI0029F4F485|nr:hemolysin family protein [uncultured Acetobacteroides sp.]